MSQNLIEVLNYELHKRKQQNAQYSLRSFARFLDVDFSTLSKALRGERRLGEKYQQKCLSRLKLSPEDLVPKTQLDSKSYHILDSDQFKLLSSWHYLAIAEALKDEELQNDWKLLRYRFKLTVDEIDEALNLLEANGFIKRATKDKIEITTPNSSSLADKTTTFARKEYLKSVFTKSLNSIDEVGFSERDHSVLSVRANRKQIENIRNEINEFRRKIDAILETAQDKQDVYHLAIGFSPVTLKKDLDSESP